MVIISTASRIDDDGPAIYDGRSCVTERSRSIGAAVVKSLVSTGYSTFTIL